MSLLGWQSMLALFLAAFVGPGQVSPDLANNAPLALPGAAVLARRIRARQNVRAGDSDVADDLGSRPAAVRPARLPGRLELDGRQRAHRLRHLLRRVDLDSAARAAGAGALRLGEVEARRRRADVRRLLRGRRLRRAPSTACSAPTGATCSTSATWSAPSGCGCSKAPIRPPTAPSSSACRSGEELPLWLLLGRRWPCWLAGICLYMLARKIRGAEVVR